jgi:hypothetical protein
MWPFKSGGISNTLEQELDCIEDECEGDEDENIPDNLVGYISGLASDKACYIYLILHDLDSRLLIYDIHRGSVTVCTRDELLTPTIVKAPQVLINQIAAVAKETLADNKHVYFSHLITDEVKKDCTGHINSDTASNIGNA